MIEIKSISLSPSTVNVNSPFLLSVAVEYIASIYRWEDLLNKNWSEISTMTWGDLFTYRNPDYRETKRYCGNFTCGQDFVF